MKEKLNKMVRGVQNVPLRIAIFAQNEARRVANEKDGLAMVEMVALTLVVVGAVVAAGAILNEVFPQLITDMLTKIKELLGL